MAAEDKQAASEESRPEVPSGPEFSTDDVQGSGPPADYFSGASFKELSESDVFVGGQELNKLLADSAKPTTQPRGPAGRGGKRFSIHQKILLIGIVLVGAMLLCTLLKPAPVAETTPPAEQLKTSKAGPADDDVRFQLTQADSQIQKSQPVSTAKIDTETQPLSLKAAHNLYLQKNYGQAYSAYNQLCQGLSAAATFNTEKQLLKDFLQFRMALCMEKSAELDKAERLFNTASNSHCPIVRALANYHCSLLEMHKKQYASAGIRAYKAIALLDAAAFDRNWALSLQRDCHFLVAASTTKDVLSLCDADKDLPEGLWPCSAHLPDPFTGLDEAELRNLLVSGSEKLTSGLLGPQIQPLNSQGHRQDPQRSPAGPPRWRVVCHSASIEELLARFAANANLDIHWTSSRQSGPAEAKDNAAKRPVSMYLSAATSQQFLSIAAGCAGLLARTSNKPQMQVVNISDPANYLSLSEHTATLTEEAIVLWQRYLLAFHDDPRLANAHFSLALLHRQAGATTEAIAEYKLVANRYPRTTMAPFALLHSSRLKVGLRDYAGARQDLKQLVEQYYDSDIAGRACLYLAEATMKTGPTAEAQRLYRKAYNLNLSTESQAASALGAGRCFYEENDYENAAKWLTRYLNLTAERTGRDACYAYFLLGKCFLETAKPGQACDAFQCALAGAITEQAKIEALAALTEARIQQKLFIEALEAAENMDTAGFSANQICRVLLIKSKILRAMGLPDNAIELIGDRLEDITDPRLTAEVQFELAKCHTAKGNLEQARKQLTEILLQIEARPLANEVALELARVCLKLRQEKQAVSVCSQLLACEPLPKVKQAALEIMSQAYIRQRKYNSAALALLGRPEGIRALKQKAKPDSFAKTQYLSQ